MRRAAGEHGRRRRSPRRTQRQHRAPPSRRPTRMVSPSSIGVGVHVRSGRVTPPRRLDPRLRCRGAGEAHERAALDAVRASVDRHLQRRRRRVAEEARPRAERELVGGASARRTDRGEADPPAVLEGRGEARFDDVQRAHGSPPSAMRANSAPVDRAERHLVAGREQGRFGAARVEQDQRRASDEAPAAGRCLRVDPEAPPRDGDAARRNLAPRRAEPGRLERVGQAVDVREPGREPEERHGEARSGERSDGAVAGPAGEGARTSSRSGPESRVEADGDDDAPSPSSILRPAWRTPPRCLGRATRRAPGRPGAGRS